MLIMRNPFTLLTKMFRNQQINDYDSLMTIPFSALNILRESNDDYGNAYPNIRAIADRFFTVIPYALDEKGQKIDQSPVALKALSRPNQSMSGVDFRNAIATMSLVHNKVYILVWQSIGGKSVPATPNIRESNIAGFTFLENVVETIVDGIRIYQSGKSIYTEKQVMVLSDLNPYNLNTGYSPARSVKKWATLEDFAADYQNGFFKNGGIPSGQFLITAPSKKEYEDVVKEMKRKYQGANKNGTAMYSYVPTDPVTGKPSQASVTWVPFNVTNKDLALKDLLEKAEKKIDGAYRVSAFIRNMDEAPNFATAQVIERNFIENTIKPFLILRWGRIQHELNRITGGLGYSIGYEIETPNIQEEELAKAQSNQANVVNINLLKAQGYTLPNIVEALDLPKRWLELETPEAVADDMTIDDNNSTRDLPEQEITSGINNSKKKEHNCSHLSWKLNSSEQEAYAIQLESPPRQLLEKQVNRAINAVGTTDKLKMSEQDDQDDEDAFLTAMMEIITIILLAEGITQWEAGKAMLVGAGIDKEMGTYIVQSEAKDEYRAYLKTIFKSYSDETKTIIRDTLANANAQGLGVEQTRAQLATIPGMNEYRVKRIAVAEANKSYSQASVESMKQLDTKLDEYVIQQSMESTTGTPCEYCSAFIGVWRTVGTKMIEKGAVITGADGGIFVNNWDDNYGHDAHSNGKCEPVYRIIDSTGKVIGK